MSRLEPTYRRPTLVVLAALSMALAAVGLQASLAAGGAPRPVRIEVESITSSVTAPAGTPDAAVPYVLVEAGHDFTVTVSFYDAAGAPASFNKDTTLSLTTNTGPDNLPSRTGGTAPAGEVTATLTTSLPNPANQVAVTVGAPGAKGPVDVMPGASSQDQLFDVLADVEFHESAPGSPFVAGIGGEDGCTSATAAQPVCGVVLLPDGAVSSQVLLSLGLCDAAYAGCGSTRGSVIQALADLEGLYTSDSPATIVVRCDKSLCGGSAVNATELSYSLLGNQPLAPAPACPAKGTIGELQEVCVDYVESKRDNAADTLLHVLFTRDARVSIR